MTADRPEVITAQMAARSDEDHVFASRTAVVVLDGATSHRRSGGPTGGDYAERLGEELTQVLDLHMTMVEALEQSILRTATALGLNNLTPAPPSCTVAAARVGDSRAIELLVLGDAAIAIGHRDGRAEVITDDRLGRLGLAESARYKERLRGGCGYDEKHRTLLVELQSAERAHRNKPGGYWIASVDPTAAHYAITMSMPLDKIGWLVLATDGVTDVMHAAGIGWTDFAEADAARLADLLQQINTWEDTVDPNGCTLPRSKRHDDKTVAVVRFDHA
jgi:hypothetical protein